MGRLVGEVLDLVELLGERLAPRPVRAQELGEEVGTRHQVSGRCGEEVEERGIARSEAQAHGRLSGGGDSDGDRLGQRDREHTTAWVTHG
ncbi:hypothetical protein AGMMS50218_15810 [Actinomycetota bacterium]|nr:hypothetical protein AGMMS50218_15810 [Actinomycetota bacterium]